MCIDLPAEKEQTLRAIVDRHDNRDENALTGREYPTCWTENDMTRHVGKSRPVQVARRACPVSHLRQAGIGPILICAVEMSDEAHR